MGKEFKDWVDEFVENGANPKDITNWPENAGGGSLTLQDFIDNSFIVTPQELYAACNHRYFNVDAFLQTLQDKGLSRDYHTLFRIAPYSFEEGGRLYYATFFELTEAGSGRYEFRIFNQVICTGDDTDYESLLTFFTNNKEAIEGGKILPTSGPGLGGFLSESVFYLTTQYDEDNSNTTPPVYFSLKEIKSWFKY